jgi:hypothetical protein
VTLSLFPFLSILTCTMGALSLLVAGLAIGQADFGPSTELAGVRDGIVTNTVTADELKRLIAEAEAIRQRLAQARAELARLQKEVAQNKADEKRILDLLGEHKQWRERVELLERELQRLRDEIAKLPPETSQDPTKRTVRVVPLGSGKGIRPTFVECTSTSLIIHPEGTCIFKSDIQDSPEFAKLVRETAAQRAQGKRVILLIRPDGVSTYWLAQQAARSQNVVCGALPVPGEGNLDLSFIGAAGGGPP